MMKQYKAIKDENEDCILFYRLGDFYEMFYDDAKTVSKELELVLTGRDCGQPERAPMCGVPYHSAEGYIARLIQKGYKIAICEQTEDPALAKGLVKREVIRRVTPGTLMESSMLEETKNNFVCGIYADSKAAGICFCDISTGSIFATQAFGTGMIASIEAELGRFSPSEAVLSDGAFANDSLREFIKCRLGCHIEHAPEHTFMLENARMLAQQHFDMSGDAGQEAINNMAALQAVGGVLSYLHETQKNDLKHINKLETYKQAQFMQLDLNARRNLEICEVMRTGAKRGSLLWVLDYTKTAMGARLIRQWLEMPLLNVAQIGRRQVAVDSLMRSPQKKDELEGTLKGIFDIERLCGRIVYGSANCRDLRALYETCICLPNVRDVLAKFESTYIGEIAQNLDCLADIAELISSAIVDEPPFSVREGEMIRDGYSKEVDDLRELTDGGRGKIAEIEQRERDRTGIPKLKIGYNRVFGYYIEISRSYQDRAPDDYIRKQTLANCERYITQELKELETKMLSASAQVTAIEYNIFCEVRDKIAALADRIQNAAGLIATADVLCSFASAAQKNDYTKPCVDNSDKIIITDGRHPVVERVLKDSLFVPNDVRLDCGENRVNIITGPNMAGKSTYMRQVALITIMAQCGSFVPAKSATIGVCDRVFTRVGASDDLASGQSTFMVEMSEVADILKNATNKSLLILDEIGRGTSTFDGMAIARAVLEYVADKKTLGAKTLFATHYHELTELEELLDGVKNYNIVVKKRGDDITFLRKIVRGGADDSYGIAVALLAGIPNAVIKRAKTVLAEIENLQPQVRSAERPEETDQISLGSMADDAIGARLRALAPDTLTPIEALGIIYELCRAACDK